jgi:hypothetical protein
MIKNKILLLICLVLLTSIALATNQLRDTIIFNGYSYPVEYDILSQYFDENPSKMPNMECHSSALERGYIAEFEISENHIFLRNITIIVKKGGCKDCAEITWENVTDKVFPIHHEGVKATWFTGLIVLPYKLISSGPKFYNSIYDRYTVFEIFKGDVIKEKVFNYFQYTIFKEIQFQFFKKTKEYQEKEKRLSIAWGKEFTNEYLKEYAITHVKKIIEIKTKTDIKLNYAGQYIRKVNLENQDKMILLDVIIGYYIPKIFGWIFLIVVIFIEGFLFSKLLCKHWFNKLIFKSITIANVLTSLAGLIIGYILNCLSLYDNHAYGGYLLNWIPIDTHCNNLLLNRTIPFFLVSFALTVIVNSIINILMLRSIAKARKIFLLTLIANIITFAIVATVITIIVLSFIK